MTQFEDVLETILEEYARRDSEGEFDTWEETDAFVKEKAEVLLAYVKEDPVSEDLDIAIGEYCSNPDNFITYIDVAFAYRSEQKDDIPLIIKAIKFGANWQKEQLMANAVDGVVHHFEKCKVASVHYNDPTGVSMAYFTSTEGLSAGDKVKIIVIKED